MKAKQQRRAPKKVATDSAGRQAGAKPKKTKKGGTSQAAKRRPLAQKKKPAEQTTRQPAGSSPAGDSAPRVPDPKVVDASFATHPTPSGAYVVSSFMTGPFGDKLDFIALMDELSDTAASVSSGNMARPEAMLLAQAHALQAIFVSLSIRASQNMGEHMGATETYLRLALKAQSQCRTTLEALAEMKNPRPVAFVRQANIANGPQQVNNGAATARAENSTKLANEVSELTDDRQQTFCPGGQAAQSSRGDSALETME